MHVLDVNAFVQTLFYNADAVSFQFHFMCHSHRWQRVSQRRCMWSRLLPELRGQLQLFVSSGWTLWRHVRLVSWYVSNNQCQSIKHDYTWGSRNSRVCRVQGTEAVAVVDHLARSAAHRLSAASSAAVHQATRESDRGRLMQLSTQLRRYFIVNQYTLAAQ